MRTHGMGVGLRMVSLALMASMFAGTVWADEEEKDMSLPSPAMSGGKPLMDALRDRQSSRSFSNQKLPPQVLSDLLWAACGINRQESKKRTAPSAKNWQEIDVYVVLEEGVYLFEAESHSLRLVIEKDARDQVGSQPFVKAAPLNLVYVSDTSRMKDADDEDKVLYSATDTGFISQNVYLYCASAGLATVVRGDKGSPTLPESLKLRPEQRIVLTQTVGYPGEE